MVTESHGQFLARVGRQLGMWTVGGTFAEACAFIQGFDAAAKDGLLDRFTHWLRVRVDQPPQLAWPGLVLSIACPGQPVQLPSLPPEQDAVAVAELFKLLEEFTAEGEAVLP